MNELLNKINAVSGISASEASEIRQNLGTGVLGFSPIPLLRPKS